MVVVGIGFLISSMFYGFANGVMKEESKQASIAYNYSAIENSAKYRVEKIKAQGANISLQEDEFFSKLFTEVIGTKKAYLTDLDGKVIKKSSNVVEDKIDIFSVMANTANFVHESNKGMEEKYIYPVTIGEDKCYFIYSDTPTAEITYTTNVVTNSFFALILTCIVFVVVFIIITNKKMKYLDEIALGLKRYQMEI